jgi:hypothetical protein
MKVDAHAPFLDVEQVRACRPSPVANGTPLHIAAFKGHLRLVWVLLGVGFSNADLDRLGNTPLHLAASAGHSTILECLIYDGSDMKLKNTYGNTPYDLAAKNLSCSAVLAQAMRDEELNPKAKTTQAERRQKNMERLRSAETTLATVTAGLHAEGGADSTKLNQLERAIANAIDVGLSHADIDAAKAALETLRMQENLRHEMSQLNTQRPVTQRSSLQSLFQTIESAKDMGLGGPILAESEQLLKTARVECLLTGLYALCSRIKCGSDLHVSEIAKLNNAVAEAQNTQRLDKASQRAEQGLVGKCVTLRKKLLCELELSRAMVEPERIENDPPAPEEGPPPVEEEAPPPEEKPKKGKKVVEEEPPPISYTYIHEDGKEYDNLLDSLKAQFKRLKEAVESCEEIEDLIEVSALVEARGRSKQLDAALVEEQALEDTRVKSLEEEEARRAKKAAKKGKKKK